ncbi:hypothetical protein Btru_002555 [Bulinus truncatus]|nr:hypothetical protein Btru_002555 [Bulinus truncatus]
MLSSELLFKNCQSEHLDWPAGQSLENGPKNCKKNRHSEFFNVSELRQKLPPEYVTDDDIIQLVEKMADLTVCVKTQKDALQVRFGSRYIQRVRQKTGMDCPDGRCQQRGVNHRWGILTITTVYHVVPTNSEAETCEVYPNYIPGNPQNEVFRGHRLLETDKEVGLYDWCAVECFTHNVQLVDELKQTIEDVEEKQKTLYPRLKDNADRLVIMIGHPHGGDKMVSLGKWNRRVTQKEIRSSQNWCQYDHNAPTCPGSSGSPVLILGQPLCGYGYWFGHPHNHSAWNEETGKAVTSIGSDSIVD